MDDTGARHRARNGVTTQLGDDRFTFFATGPSKSRGSFLAILRAGHEDYVVNAEALALKREQVPESVYVFTSERRGPMTPATFRKMLTTIGAVAELPFPVHPHMLRHACGYKLANDGHDTRALQEWLGHSNRERPAGPVWRTPRGGCYAAAAA